MQKTGWRLRRALALGVGGASAIAAIAAGPASAATVTVTTTADISSGPADAGGCASGDACSLRQALVAARGSDTRIVLPAGRLALTQGALAIDQGSGTVTLIGAGPANTAIEQTTANSRVFEIAGGGASVIADVTVRGGSVRGADGQAGDGTSEPGDGEQAEGGGIRNLGALELVRATVRENSVIGGFGGAAAAGAVSAGDGGRALGAGIANRGTLRLVDSTVERNRALGGIAGTVAGVGTAYGLPGAAAGGGIAHLGGTLAIDGSTLSDNDASGAPAITVGASLGPAGSGAGGALWASAPFELRRSTVAFNGAGAGRQFAITPPPSASRGGGIWTSASGSLDAVTMTVNSAAGAGISSPVVGQGGAIYSVSDQLVSARSTLITDPTFMSLSNCDGVLRSLGGNVESGGSCGFVGARNGKIELGGVGEYGGPTGTVMLPPDSPALNAGSCDGPELDQRGFPRNVGGGCDAGAVERRGPMVELLRPLDGFVDSATLRVRLTHTAGTTYRFIASGVGTGVQDTGARALPPTTGDEPIVLEQPLSGLVPGSSYTYRLVLVGPEGESTTTGDFSTSSVPDPVRRAEPRAPALTKVTAKPASFQVRKARGKGRRRRVSGGTTIRFTLSARATVSARVERLPARRGGKARAVGTLALGSGKAGANRVAFTGRVGRRTLAPGRYRLTLTAKAGALTSRAATLVLVVRRG